MTVTCPDMIGAIGAENSTFACSFEAFSQALWIYFLKNIIYQIACFVKAKYK
jgi:hypothetical protein